MDDVLQVIGAVMVLAGYTGSQLGWLDAKSVTYLVLNAVGAGLLSVLALLGEDWGFLLLEGVWTAVSLAALAGVRRRGKPAG
jgi:hypothetical protein